MSFELTGWFRKEIYYNPHSDYLVGKVQVSQTTVEEDVKRTYFPDGLLTIVGFLPKLHKDDLYTFTGIFEKSNYGVQFRVETYEINEKKDEESLIDFLSSDLFIGIGKKTARKIVRFLGEDTIERILNDPDVLDEISVSHNTKKRLYDTLVENVESEQMIRFLLKHGFGYRLAKKIYKKYLGNTKLYLQENPYRLIDDIEGIGFKRADHLALSLNFDLTSPYRIQAAIFYSFEEVCFNEGFTYLLDEQLIERVQAILNEFQLPLENEEIKKNITQLVESHKIIQEDKAYFLPSLYEAEVHIAKKIQLILSNKEDQKKVDLELILQEVEKEVTITYTDQQKKAIKTALQSNITILTGGPGTGKTTVVNGLIKAYCRLKELPIDDIGKTIALVAPTGRAAKRLAETTHLEAMTIHRLLGYSITGTYSYDETHPLKYQLIICDETSMIDLLLSEKLLMALNPSIKIVFVGDMNQLPSVGPGEVLKDFIQSGILPTIHLDKIHRQSAESSIITLAHDILHQIVSKDLLEKQNDRNFIRCSNDQLLERLTFIMTNALGREYSIDQVQVLAPMYKGPVGIDQINRHLQETVNPKHPDKKELKFINQLFRQGDKVIQLINRPDDYVMNGDIGYIRHVFLEEEEGDCVLIVDYDGIEVRYSQQDLSEISLAYCISIHKSQGSEFPIVILALSKSYRMMLRKKLLYTAVTRAKKSLILLGEVEAYQIALKNTYETPRQTKLLSRLKQDLDPYSTEIDGFTFKLTTLQVTPYDFL